MKKNKIFFLKRLFSIIFFVLFGTLNLYAEDPNPAGELFASKDEIPEGSNNAVTIDIPGLDKNSDDLQVSLNILSDSVSKLQIWQIVSAISLTLIALLSLVVVVLILLKQMRFHVVVEHEKKPADEIPVKGHQPLKESKAVSQEILSSELDALKKEREGIKHQLTKLNNTVESQSENSSRFRGDLTSFQAEIANLKQTIKSTNDAVSLLKTDIDKDREKLARKEQLESDPVAFFNQWAQNPHLSFPQYFTYVTNVKLEFRIKQEFTDTNIETEWIRNTIGEKKYLFPNPNKIDNLAGPIDKLYKVAGTRKAKGANSVKITSACQIKEDNFIEYQGELTLM